LWQKPPWRAIAADPETPVLVVFQGPQAYVTPSWYETKRETGKVVPTGELWAGSPAKKMRDLTDDDVAMIHRTAENYSNLARTYMAGR
jgi:transcriptional regulator